MDRGLLNNDSIQSGDRNPEFSIDRSRIGHKRHSTENIEQIIAHIPTPAIFTDEYGALVGFNQLATDLLGEIPAISSPTQWPEKLGLYLPDGKSIFPGKSFPLLRALNGETVAAQEVLHLNGQPSNARWISLSAGPILDRDGSIAGAILFLSDITDRKQLEISLDKKVKLDQAAYTFQMQITEIGNDPLRILHQVVAIAAQNIGDGCVASLLNIPADRLKVLAFHHTNPTAYNILYNTIVSREYVLEDAIEGVVSSGAPLLISSVDQERLKQAALPEQMEYFNKIGIQSVLIVPIKGRDRIIGTLSLIRDRGGSAYTSEDQTYFMDLAYRTGLAIDNNYLVGLVQSESTEKRSAQKAFEQIDMRFQSIFNSTTLGIKLLDLNGDILETNPAFRKMVDYTEEELVGKSIYKLWHPGDRIALEGILEKQNHANAQSVQLEHRLITKDGSTIWLNVTFTRIKNHSSDQSSGFIVAIAENITARKQIETEMTKMKSRLQGHIELERLRLAQELHDGPLQDIYSAIFKLENWLKQADPPNQVRIIALKQDLTNVIQGLRSTAKDLRPPALADFGLERAIRSYAEEFNDDHSDLTIHLNLAHDGQILPEDVRLILFRVFQHSITNILRHAKATDVYVRFSFDAEDARLEIADNGVGFVVHTNWVDLVKQGHFGLAGAVERVALLDGLFYVDSTPGEGTIVRVQIPIPETSDCTDENNCED